jgi:hypothetical protein
MIFSRWFRLVFRFFTAQDELPLAHQFNNSLLHTRIAMLRQPRTDPWLAHGKTALSVGLATFAALAIGCANSPSPKPGPKAAKAPPPMALTEFVVLPNNTLAYYKIVNDSNQYATAIKLVGNDTVRQSNGQYLIRLGPTAGPINLLNLEKWTKYQSLTPDSVANLIEHFIGKTTF